MMFLNKFLVLFLIILVCISNLLNGQNAPNDSLKLTIDQADSLFLLRNQSLLSERFNIDAARAQIIQARLFTNPNITFNQNIYNPDRKTWFEFSNAGESSASIQKLFLLASKRNKKISLASLATEKEEHVYYDLLRTLRYNLHSTFYTLYYLNLSLQVYAKEIQSISTLIEVYRGQVEKGYVSKKELLRLKASQFSLENEKLGLSSQQASLLADFNVLMHSTNTFYKPSLQGHFLEHFNADSLVLLSLIDSAFSNRYDLKSAQWDVKISEANLQYQKALSVPDLTLSVGWDRNGSFVHNYNYVGLQFDLPFFDRNQGNIKSAKFTNESMKARLQSEEDQVKSDVVLGFSLCIENNQVYKRFDTRFISDFDLLIIELIRNYEKKNISLLEFLDYYDAYKQNQIQFNNLQTSRINAIENLNYSLGKEIIKNQ
jgi:outer membrane protein, heavy metal efflux system